MTTLHRSLAFYFGGATLIAALGFSASSVRAQFGYEQVAPAASAQDAAKMFAQLLARQGDDASSTASLLYATVSRKDLDEIGNAAVGSLLTTLAKDAKYPQFEASLPQGAGDQTVVDVRPAAVPAALPVVCVREEGVWKVNLLQTFAKRRGLGEGKFQTAIFDLTGVALPGLPGADRPDVQGRICQNNLQQVGQGLLQYSQDYDERLPRASKWTEELKPYARNERFFSCPLTRGNGGYAFNSNFALVHLAQINTNDVNRTPIFYETRRLGFNVSGTGADLERRHAYKNNPKPEELSSLFVVTSGQVMSEAINPSPRRALNFTPKLGPEPKPYPEGFLVPPSPVER